MTEYEVRIRRGIQDACEDHNICYRPEDFDIEDSVQYSHGSPEFRRGKKSVLMFIEQGAPDRILGVYYCGENTEARFRYQHYLINGANSTLAKTLYKTVDSGHYQDVNVGEWIHQYTRRINIFFSKDYAPDKPGFINTLKYHLQKEFDAQYNLA